MLIIITIIILTASYFAYRMAFQAPARTDFTKYVLPVGEQYTPHYRVIKQSADNMITVPYEKVYITAFDKTKLFARYYHVKDNAPLHIMFHGYKSNPYIDCCGGSRIAMDLGHNALVIDQRAHGKSEGKAITFGIKERKDCLSWIKYSCKRFGTDTPIFLWGVSMGAATILMATDLKLPANVVGIVADCPFSSPKEIIMKVAGQMKFPPKLIYPFVRLGAFIYGHFNLEESSAVEAMKSNHIPVLLFHGDDDRFVPCKMSHSIHAACPSHITFRKIPKAGHGLCYMIAAEKYREAVISFINKILT